MLMIRFVCRFRVLHVFAQCGDVRTVFNQGPDLLFFLNQGLKAFFQIVIGLAGFPLLTLAFNRTKKDACKHLTFYH